jgi:hypothetical protein
MGSAKSNESPRDDARLLVERQPSDGLRVPILGLGSWARQAKQMGGSHEQRDQRAGIAFLLIYPLGFVWPSGWVWHGGEGAYYLQMLRDVYAVLGIFLIAAAKNPGGASALSTALQKNSDEVDGPRYRHLSAI